MGQKRKDQTGQIQFRCTDKGSKKGTCCKGASLSTMGSGLKQKTYTGISR